MGLPTNDGGEGRRNYISEIYVIFTSICSERMVSIRRGVSAASVYLCLDKPLWVSRAVEQQNFQFLSLAKGPKVKAGPFSLSRCGRPAVKSQYPPPLPIPIPDDTLTCSSLDLCSRLCRLALRRPLFLPSLPVPASSA